MTSTGLEGAVDLEEKKDRNEEQTFVNILLAVDHMELDVSFPNILVVSTLSASSKDVSWGLGAGVSDELHVNHEVHQVKADRALSENHVDVLLTNSVKRAK